VELSCKAAVIVAKRAGMGLLHTSSASVCAMRRKEQGVWSKCLQLSVNERYCVLPLLPRIGKQRALLPRELVQIQTRLSSCMERLSSEFVVDLLPQAHRKAVQYDDGVRVDF
ncbi:MAG: hypothetical protein ACOCZ8_06240, partial [Bacteroidota bacterium]